jgi:magnesium transporter
MPRLPDEQALQRIAEQATGCTLLVQEFDFGTRTSRVSDLPSMASAMQSGRFVWLDVDFKDPIGARHLLEELGLISEQVVEDMFADDPGTQLGRHPNYLHLVLTACRFEQAAALTLERIDVVMGQTFLLTVHEGARSFLEGVKRDCHDDFARFAQSPSFLMYEIWDHLTDHYVSVEKRLEKRVSRLQAQLFQETDESVFNQVSAIGSDLLHFRSVLSPARSVLMELSARRSIFLSEITQTFLQNMVGTVERVLQDVLVERDILTQALNLYMSMVGHRTNRAMNRLTVISVVFLPLTFLCGVYGMNFEHLPELHWRYGYHAFWAVTVLIATTIVIVMRRARLL